MPLILRQSAIQLAAAVLGFMLLAPLAAAAGVTLGPLGTTAGIGLLAGALAWGLREPPWWRVIHLGFAPLLYAALRLELEGYWFGLALLASLAVFGRVQRSRVPLFLSNRQTARAVAALLPPDRPAAFTDLGAGVGSVLLPVAAARPATACHGVEHAPLPWAVGCLRCLLRPNARMRWGDMWRRSLAGTDLLYVFLSPAPMARLWDKACREMAAGTVVVSNSFPVPGVVPEREIRVDDRRQTRLYLYRIP